MSIAEIQRALKLAGNDPGPIDGAWGRKSIAACKAYQSANGLVVDGIPGPKTLAKLFSSNVSGAIGAATPIWYREAQRALGTKEAAGAANNAVIIGWAKKLGGWVASYFTADSIRGAVCSSATSSRRRCRRRRCRPTRSARRTGRVSAGS